MHKMWELHLDEGKGKFVPLYVVKVWRSGDIAHEMRKIRLSTNKIHRELCR